MVTDSIQYFFFFQAEDGIRDDLVTGVQTCALPILEETITNERPSVILLDIVMPGRNGFQVCRDLKGNAEFNMIPVIMVTSKDSASDKFWGQQQGADAYVTKPFTREDLLPAVRPFVSGFL